MGRKPCCNKDQVNKGVWSIEEDQMLTDYIGVNGEGNWRHLPLKAGLNRCGKSCRLRWVNYLRPNIKRGGISEDEEDLIVRLHKLLGNRWALIAGRLPGRTDNEIKNYWNTILRKKIQGAKKPTRASKSMRIPLMGLDPNEAHQLNETKEIMHTANVKVPQEPLVRINEELKMDKLPLSESPSSEKNLEITNDENEDNKVMGGDFVSLNHHLWSSESLTNLENGGEIGGLQFFEDSTDISEKWDVSECDDLTFLLDSGFKLESLENLLFSDEEGRI